mgnify:CR=1 FL=1
MKSINIKNIGVHINLMEQNGTPLNAEWKNNRLTIPLNFGLAIPNNDNMDIPIGYFNGNNIIRGEHGYWRAIYNPDSRDKKKYTGCMNGIYIDHQSIKDNAPPEPSMTPGTNEEHVGFGYYLGNWGRTGHAIGNYEPKP